MFKNSMSIEHFLQQTVAMVSKHLHCNVCSIYIYDEDEKVLTLKATQGLNPKAANTVQLQLGQGLAEGGGVEAVQADVHLADGADKGQCHIDDVRAGLTDDAAGQLVVDAAAGVLRKRLTDEDRRNFLRESLEEIRGRAER